MKKVYYFSESELKFVQLKRFQLKYIFVLLIPVFLFLFLHLSGVKILNTQSVETGSYINGNQNSSIQKKAAAVISEYKLLEKKLNNLIKQNNDLRVTANLPPVDDEERLLGIGGGIDFSMFHNNNPELKDLDDIEDMLENFSTRIDFEKHQYKQISNKLKQNNSLFEAIPALKPCTGILAASGFGTRLHPILKVRRMHNGIDIITNTGTPVYAAGKGRITFAGRRGGYGLAVEIDHGFGYHSIYGHLSKIFVRVGQSVKRSFVIAESGNTGLSTGPHLHYEVHHNGIKMDPEDFFFDDLSLFGK